MDSRAPGDALAFARFLRADGEIFIIMSSFTLLRKLFSVQTKNVTSGLSINPPQETEKKRR
jgi:hypothetical protein